MLLPVWTVDPSKLYGSDDVDVKVKSKAEKKRLRGEESDESMMTGSDDDSAPNAKKSKKNGKEVKKAAVEPTPVAAPTPSPKKAAASPKAVKQAAAPEPKAEKEPKKVLAGKTKDALPAKKKTAGAAGRSSVKASVIGKKKQ